MLLVPAVFAQEGTGQVVGVICDSFNAMALPGALVTVVDTNEVVYSELDGAFSLSLPAGSYEIFSFVTDRRRSRFAARAGAAWRTGAGDWHNEGNSENWSRETCGKIGPHEVRNATIRWSGAGSV